MNNARVGNGGTDRMSRPWHPYVVLVSAMFLPGAGQIMNGQPSRGLLMVFYIVLLAAVSFHLTTPEHSILGRYAGGWFIYAMSFMDAYRTARFRWENYLQSGGGKRRGG